MKRSGILATGLIVLAWLVFGGWQWREYIHQRKLVRTALEQQAESIVDCLVGSIQSHRWVSPYFESQLPGTLEQIASSESVLAIAINPIRPGGSGRADLYTAGNDELIKLADFVGKQWCEKGYYAIREFELREVPPPQGGGGGRNGGGQGGGGREGMGMGMGRRSRWSPDQTDAGVLNASPATQFKAILILDRSGADTQILSAARNRCLLALMGGLFIASIGLVWRSTVRLADEQGRADVLRAEARHLSELGYAAAGLAHETRNPLGLIRGWAQRLANMGQPTTEQQQQADTIVEECDRVTSRINEFLAFARPVEPELNPVPVKTLVEQLQVLFEPDLSARDIQFDFSDIPSEIFVEADAEQFRQAIFNLVQNAITFAGEGGCVTVSMVPTSPQTRRPASKHPTWCLKVADNGPGVDPQCVDSLFKPYFTTRATGTGLGLAIVQRIALAHGWVASYANAATGGAVFQVDQIREADPQ